MKKIQTFNQHINENKTNDETTPEYYLKQYRDDEVFTSIKRIKRGEFKDTQYTGPEYRELFMEWYNKIKPYLDNNDEWGALEILIDWDEETLAKMDIYSLVKKYFKK